MVDYVAWVDVESDGLNPYTGNSLLEVAAIVTDFEFNVITPEPYKAVVKFSAEEIVDLKETAGEYVLNMHSKTGLWDKLVDGKPLTQIDAELYEFFKSVSPEPRNMVLGGNSITLDRNFLNASLPTAAEHLHYRSIDVTTVALLAQKWFNIQYKKKTLHSALEDINESIDEIKFLRENIFINKGIKS